MTKLYAQEKQVFDINKVTVVGNLTITSDGIASGFKSYNSGDESYLTLPTVFNPQDKPWKIIIKATIGEWISGAPYASLLGTGIRGVDYQGIALALGANQISCWLRSNTGTGWDIGNIRTTFTFTVGETYYFQIEFTGTKYILSVSKDRKNWEIKGSIEKSLPIYVSAQPLTIGDNKYNDIASTCWNGSIDLMETYVYIDNQIFFNPTKPVYSLERRKPKVWNKGQFTIVGNPSISESGIASGFSSGNYVKTTGFPISSLNVLKYQIKIKLPQTSISDTRDILTPSTPFGGFFYTRLFLDNLSRLTLYAYDGTNTGSIVSAELTQYLGKYLYIECEVSNAFRKFTILSEEKNIIFQREHNKLLTWEGEDNNYLFTIGRYSNTTYYTGSINLKSLKIYTDNNLVFDGGAETYVYDASKFTVVGSPTITEYGVASGFTLDNYLTASQTLDLSKPFKICMGFLHKDVTKQEALMSFNGGIWENYLLVNHFSYGDTLPFYLRFEDNTTASMTVLNYVLKDNTFYYVEFLWDGSVYTLRVSENNKDWGEATYTSSKALYGYSSINTICIGKMIAKNYYPFEAGLIDLPSISITVDGKEVFTGAKEKFYAMRGR